MRFVGPIYLFFFLLLQNIYALEITPSSACDLDLAKIYIHFKSDDGVSEPPAVKIETPTRLTDIFQEAIKRTDAALANNEFPGGNAAEYRSHLQGEIALLKAKSRAKERIEALRDRGLIPEDQEAIDRAFNQIVSRELSSADRETILFVDTPVLGKNGSFLNRKDGAIFVIDHHGPYAPTNPLDNSGAQVIARLADVAGRFRKPDGSVDTEKALREFNRELYGEKPGSIVLSSDNLADAAEVMAILKSPELQRRIIEHPELAKMLTESGRFTDFFVFGGDGYEKANTSPQSKEAIALSKAIMFQHSALLKQAGIPFGDRVVGLADKEKQKELLEQATKEAEKILLAATTTDPQTRPAKLKELEEAAAKFDAYRSDVSVKDAVVKHQKFQKELKGDLSQHLSPELAEKGEAIINRLTYGHQPVSTGNQFADWAASPMANAYDPNGKRPIKFELAGNLGTDTGKPVIIAKSGGQELKVDLRPLADALNLKAKEKYRAKLKLKGEKDEAIEEILKPYAEFTARGTDLVFSFGGHSLSRSEISSIVAQTLLEQSSTIVPK